jgi:hypothetical protein
LVSVEPERTPPEQADLELLERVEGKAAALDGAFATLERILGTLQRQ